MLKMRTLIILSFILIVSCQSSKPRTDSHVLDFGAFTIEVPKTWTKVKQQGIDSYAGGIAISLTDTIGFDLGAWSNTLTEPEPVIWERRDLQYHKNVDTTQIVLVEDRRRIDPDKFKRQNLNWDTIDGREAKIVFPRKAGRGITGIYIDSVWTSKFGVGHFNLYGTNLQPDNQEKFLKAIKTLKFKQRR
jgi:hypothetical protein